jgi:type IV pilus assembly protein PilM
MIQVVGHSAKVKPAPHGDHTMAAPQSGVWGIDLGQCALKALRLQMVDGAVKATAFDYIEHAKILSQPDADPDQLVREALTQFLSRNNLKGDTVVISVPGQSGLARFVKLPPVEEKKIADIVRFEAKQQIPFPLEEVVWDFQKISEGTVTDGFAMETEIGLFAMKRDMVNRALQHFKDVHVEVHVIQMAPLALVNYVAYDLLSQGGSGEPGKRDCVVALDIGTDNSNLVITDGARIIWQRPIPLGGNHFTRALTKELKLTFAKAEHLKRNAVKSPELKKILAALKPVLNDFVGEVQRSLGYFTNTHRDANIQYMIGLGNAFRLPGIQKYLQEKLQLEVRKLQAFERIKGDEVLGAPQFSENIMSFGVPFGLGLQGLKQTKLQTNLLPYEVRVERIVRGKKPWAVAAAASLLLAIAAMTLGSSMAKSAVDNPAVAKAHKSADETIAKERKFAGENSDIKKQIDDSYKAIDRIGAGVKERFQWQLLMRYIDLALPQPDGAKLTTRAELNNNQDVFKQYMKPDAFKALRMYNERRFAKDAGQANAQKLAQDEEFIKAHLVQMSIEGINTLYSEELPAFFKKLYKDAQRLRGMYKEEADQIIALASGGEEKNLPTKGYVTEIRGYTYHEDGQEFIIKTLLENLKKPEQPNVNPGIDKEYPGMKAQIMDNLGYFVLYKLEEVKNPEPGIFMHIKTSHLRSLLRGEAAVGNAALGGQNPMAGGMPAAGNMPAAVPGPGKGGGGEDKGEKGPNRDSWKPLGDIAGSALVEGGGGGGALGAFSVAAAGPVSDRPAADEQQPMSPRGSALGPMGVGPKNPGGAPGNAAPVATQRVPRWEFVVLFVWKEPAVAGSNANPANSTPTPSPSANPNAK